MSQALINMSQLQERVEAAAIDFGQVVPIKLTRTDIPDEKSRKAGVAPKALLKADKDAGCIVLDSETTLSGIPREAWMYTLGNRSALEWILDQYKEKKPKDPTIREKSTPTASPTTKRRSSTF